MPPCLIQLSKRIILNHTVKDQALRALYIETKNLLQNIFDASGLTNWTEAKKTDSAPTNATILLNSEDNRKLKSISKTLTGIPIGPKNESIKVLSGRIEVIDGIFGEEKSYSFALYLTLQVCTLLEIIGDSILVTIGDQSQKLKNGVDTFILKMGEEYDIVHYKQL